jgi:hypothetical protein
MAFKMYLQLFVCAVTETKTMITPRFNGTEKGINMLTLPNLWILTTYETTAANE